ncbi:MAG: hypothetical protein ACFCVG_06855 [Kineosporiaceae bacterium]
MGRTTVTVVGVVAVTAMGMAGCAGTGEDGPAVQADGGTASGSAGARSDTLVGAGYDGRFEVTATVLDDGAAGPQLCAGGVQESYPPQCAGPPVAGWDWDAVDHEAASGVRWGSYRLVGTWDGETFTVTEQATPPAPSEPGVDGSDGFTVPCQPPPGGFPVADPARTGEADFSAAAAALEQRPDVGSVAVDQSGAASGATAEPTGLEDVLPPEEWVLVVTTTGDVAEVEAAARELWGGPLCVAPAARTGEELRAVQEAITGGGSGDGLVEEFLSVGVDAQAEQVVVTVLLATQDLQDRLDAEFGEGVVRLEGALRPID